MTQAPFRPPQILLSEEHHLDATKCRNSVANLEFKGGTTLWNLGIHMEATPRTTVGTTIPVDASLMTVIKEQCVLVEGQMQCFILQFTLKETLGILNIYATFTSQEHEHMWLNVAENIALVDHWLLAGNFNMREQDATLNAWTNRKMKCEEILNWQQLTIHLGVEDVWHLNSFSKNTEKIFTFDNGHRGAQVALSHIHCFYVFAGLDNRGGRTKIVASLK